MPISPIINLLTFKNKIMAKTKQLGNQATSDTHPAMPTALRDKLNDTTINQALKDGIIDDLGDNSGQFIFEHATENLADTYYAVVQGYAVRCSDTLIDRLTGCKTVEESDNLLGNCRFTKGISNVAGDGFGKEYFRLGLPAGINLKETAAIRIGVEPVETGK